jgi:hypothetical protein
MAKKRLVKASISSVMAEKSKAGVESSSSIVCLDFKDGAFSEKHKKARSFLSSLSICILRAC